MYAILYCACAKFEQNRTMHVEEMVGDTFKSQNGCQSAIFDRIVIQNDVHMYTITYCLFAKYE